MDEVALGDAAGDGVPPAEPQEEQRPAGGEGHHRGEQCGLVDAEPHRTALHLLVLTGEGGDLRLLLRVRLDRADPGDVLLRPLRELGELLLDLEEPLLHVRLEVGHQDDDHREVGERDERQPHVDEEHEREPGDEDHDRAADVDDGRADEVADGLEVVRQTRHEVAGAGLNVELLIQREQMPREVLA